MGCGRDKCLPEIESTECLLDALGVGEWLCLKLDFVERGGGARVATPGTCTKDRRRIGVYRDRSEGEREMVCPEACCMVMSNDCLTGEDSELHCSGEPHTIGCSPPTCISLTKEFLLLLVGKLSVLSNVGTSPIMGT
jgi:hypothetical protein